MIVASIKLSKSLFVLFPDANNSSERLGDAPKGAYGLLDD